MLIKDKNGNWLDMPLENPTSSPEWFKEWVKTDFVNILKEMESARNEQLKDTMEYLGTEFGKLDLGISRIIKELDKK